MPAVLYARRSHPSEKRNVSLDLQLAHCRHHAEGLNAAIATEVVDDGVSGGTRARFPRLLAAIEEHQADLLIVYHLDRLARDVAGALDLVRLLATRHCTLHVAGQGPVEATSSAGYLTFTVNGMLAEHYRILCGEKARDALARLRVAGKRYCRDAPYGWAWDATGALVCSPGEAQAIRLAKEWLGAGLSYRAVARKLQESGYVDRTGSPYHPEQIRRNVQRAGTASYTESDT
jgi:DNA invertase Pin-like site-specific DNA recombinase